MANCPLCQTAMERRTISSGNAAGIALAIVVFVIGIVLCATCYGAIVGVPMIVCSLFMGGKRETFLVCPACGAKQPAV